MKILLIFCLVLADDTDAVTTITGYRGRSVQIQCPYEPGYEKYKKYLCRGKCPYVGYNDIPVESGSPAKDPRFSLYDNTTAKIFTVTITDLRPEDKGTYWCAIEQPGTNIYTELLLLVKTDDPAVNTVSHTTHTTHTTHAASTHSSSSVHAETTESTAGTALNNAAHPVSPPSSPQEFPTSSLIVAVSVVLVLLLIALLFVVARQRKKKTQAKPPQASSNDVAPVSNDETEDIRRLSHPVYSTPRLPTSPLTSSQTIYSNTGLPTAPSEYPQPLYSTVQHPSDSADQGDYSTANLPTTLSDSSVSAAPPSAVKPAESPTYTTLRFDTSSAGAAPAVISRNENHSCDYANVNITLCG
ncbi:CMRF35-like molecule 3 isoform X1 [Neoarius graeffei]|uniref:CMRF35-like molecule 3 isoform X1 n=1 Tax=Neoarius graeffei TaxID=443677 RepID=UPI00298CDEEC|nr:CMRF35-like molecule 3 isoform X1 [Neoarius graeffei]